MEEQIVDQFPEPLPDDEPIDSHVDRDTQTDTKMWRECATQVRHLFQKRKQLARLTTNEQFVFTLVRLRRNPSLEMLCDIFDITTGTGSRIFKTWILFLENE